MIKLEVIERDVVSGSEVLHWVTHFPYPMYSRDYVYVRRYSVDEENNVMVLVSRAVEHPSVPESPNLSGSDRTNPRWLSVPTSHLMRMASTTC